MRFGDVVMAVASLAVVMILIAFPLGMLIFPVLGFFWGQNVTAIVSLFLSALIVGLVFGGKMREGRMEAICQITVLAAVLMMLNVALGAAVFSDYTEMVKDAYLEANPGAELSASDWYIVVSRFTLSLVFVNVAIALGLVFVGLYAGSMLRRS